MEILFYINVKFFFVKQASHYSLKTIYSLYVYGTPNLIITKRLKPKRVYLFYKFFNKLPWHTLSLVSYWAFYVTILLSPVSYYLLNHISHGIVVNILDQDTSWLGFDPQYKQKFIWLVHGHSSLVRWWQISKWTLLNNIYCQMYL